MNQFLVPSVFKCPLTADRNWLWTWSLLPHLGLGLLAETNRNCNWKESLGGNGIAQLLHVEESIAIKLHRALTLRVISQHISCQLYVWYPIHSYPEDI